MGLFEFRATDGVAETTPKKTALARVIAAITGKEGVFIW
jgi:hypothetical protein